MLPNEEDNRRQILLNFGGEFRRADKMLSLGLELLDSLMVEKDSSFDPKTKGVLLGLATRAIRQFRSAVLLCEFGQLENADLLTRSIYENLLAVRFIVGPVKKPTTARKLPRVPRGHHPVDFRALVYMAHSPIRAHEELKKVLRTRGLKRAIPNEIQRRVVESSDDARRAVGPTWAALLASSQSYSGWQVAQLAESVSLMKTHRQAYWQWSHAAHAANAGSFLSHTETTTYLSIAVDVSRLPLTLRMATGLFGMLFCDFDKVFQSGFKERFDALAREFPLFK